MTSNNLFMIFGNGNRAKGYELLCEIAARLVHAREKHGWQGYTPYTAVTVIQDEVVELSTAICAETLERQHDEALDVAATVIRFLGEEWK